MCSLIITFVLLIVPKESVPKLEEACEKAGSCVRAGWDAVLHYYYVKLLPMEALRPAPCFRAKWSVFAIYL